MNAVVARAGCVVALAWTCAGPMEAATRTDAPGTNVPKATGMGPVLGPGPGPGPGRGATSGAVMLRAERQRPWEIPDPWHWPKVGAGAAALVAVGVAGFRWWRRRAAPEAGVPEPLDPGWVARARILGARSGIADPRWYVGEVSDAARGYLEARFGLRAPEQTTEEFLASLASKPLPGLGDDEALAGFLAQCDLVKFAGWRPGGAELEGLEAAALGLVDRTRSPAGTGAGPGVAAREGRTA